jgi:hypothetical protein
MDKMKLRHILPILVALALITCIPGFAQEKGVPQLATPEGSKTPIKGEVGPLKENICKNPKLCESLEIDLLDQLTRGKVPVYLPQLQANKSTENYKVSLNFGVAVADALSSVVNQNKESYLADARLAQEYGKRLGTPEAMLRKSAQLTESAAKGDWGKLGPLTYQFKDDISENLDKRNLKDEVSLALVSGALEGLYILAKSVEKDFSEKTGRLLDNQYLVSYLKKSLDSLHVNVKEKKEVKAISEALPQIDKIIKQPKTYSYKKEDAEKLIKILEPLRTAIVS